MKTFSLTNKINQKSRSHRFFILSILIFCLFGWSALHAEGHPMDDESNLQERLSEALEPVAESDYEIEGWLLNFSDIISIEEFQAAYPLDLRLVQALAPVTEEEPALEAWLVEFSESITGNTIQADSQLKIRLAEALQPIADPEPELEDWMFRISDILLQSGC
jgi:hypothetical protein